MDIFKMKVDEYLEEISSKKSTPGGGTVAGVIALEGLSLIMMSINFTIDKKGYEEVQGSIIKYKEILEKNANDLKSITKKDSEYFLKLMDVFLHYEKENRIEKLQEAYINAMNIPYEIMKISHKNMKISLKIISIANKNLITDSLMGYLLSKSAYMSAKMNVEINLKYIKDDNLVREIREDIKKMDDEINSFDREYEKLYKI